MPLSVFTAATLLIVLGASDLDCLRGAWATTALNAGGTRTIRHASKRRHVVHAELLSDGMMEPAADVPQNANTPMMRLSSVDFNGKVVMRQRRQARAPASLAVENEAQKIEGHSRPVYEIDAIAFDSIEPHFVREGDHISLPGDLNSACDGGVDGEGSCAGSLTYKFYADRAQLKVMFQAEIKAPDPLSSDFTLKMDGGEDKVWKTGSKDYWWWSEPSPEFVVGKGEHTLMIKGRRDGIKIRKLKFSGDGKGATFEAVPEKMVKSDESPGVDDSLVSGKTCSAEAFCGGACDMQAGSERHGPYLYRAGKWSDTAECIDQIRVSPGCSFEVATERGGGGATYKFTYSSCMQDGDGGPGFDKVRSIRLIRMDEQPTESSPKEKRKPAIGYAEPSSSKNKEDLLTCANFDCGAVGHGWHFSKIDADHIACSATGCATTDCCEIACESHDCPEPLGLRGDFADVVCAGEYCTDKECCVDANAVPHLSHSAASTASDESIGSEGQNASQTQDKAGNEGKDEEEDGEHGSANKNTMMIAGVALIVIFVGGAVVAASMNKSPEPPQKDTGIRQQPQQEDEEPWQDAPMDVIQEEQAHEEEEHPQEPP